MVQSLSRVQFQVWFALQRVRYIAVCLNLNLIPTAHPRAEICWQGRGLFLDPPHLGFKMRFHDSC